MGALDVRNPPNPAVADQRLPQGSTESGSSIVPVAYPWRPTDRKGRLRFGAI